MSSIAEDGSLEKIESYVLYQFAKSIDGGKMSPIFGVLIMMNNYFHDVATALLMASGVSLWLIVKRLNNTNDASVINYFLNIYSGMTRLAKFSLIWILVGGVPRTIFYVDFEWANAVGKSQVPALIVKHILAFTFVGIGVHIWIRLNKSVKEIRSRSKA